MERKMIKIFISVRNRLAITKKCIEALKKHSKIKHQIYVYDNASNYKLDEHFKYFYDLYRNGDISQITFTTEETTFKAFSKASTSNFFGRQHEEDPSKDSYQFLVLMDNDIIVTPNWDLKIRAGWEYVIKNKLNNIKVIGQRPGGIKNLDEKAHQIAGDMTAKIGRLGGSGLWAVKPNFFREVGFLNLKPLVGQHKKHDQQYWALLQKSSGGKPYIMGLQSKLGYHCGSMAGSVCNRLTKNGTNPKIGNIIDFERQEAEIDAMTFDNFYKSISSDKRFIRGW
jgi:hypothetical protein